MSTAANPLECIRSKCVEPRLVGLDLCRAHHEEIVLGLDECKARECDQRIPFGSLWCAEHKQMRDDGRLSASGERLDELDESTSCRICGAAALKRTVGKRPQGGWSDLCQEHYDEKRKTHGRSLAIAREVKHDAPRRGPVMVEPGTRSISIPDHLQPKVIDTSPDAEVLRRGDYLLEHGWKSGFSTREQADRWFLPVGVTQPAGGRTLDEAYACQVGIESGRHGSDVSTPESVGEARDDVAPLAGEGPGSEPSPSSGAPRSSVAEEPRSEDERRGHADGCLLDSDHDGDCETATPLPPSPFDLAPLNGQPAPAGAAILESELAPIMDWECYAEPSTWCERAAILVTIAAELDRCERELAVLRARWDAFARPASAVPSAE